MKDVKGEIGKIRAMYYSRWNNKIPVKEKSCKMWELLILRRIKERKVNFSSEIS